MNSNHAKFHHECHIDVQFISCSCCIELIISGRELGAPVEEVEMSWFGKARGVIGNKEANLGSQI